MERLVLIAIVLFHYASILYVHLLCGRTKRSITIRPASSPSNRQQYCSKKSAPNCYRELFFNRYIFTFNLKSLVSGQFGGPGRPQTETATNKLGPQSVAGLR